MKYRVLWHIHGNCKYWQQKYEKCIVFKIKYIFFIETGG